MSKPKQWKQGRELKHADVWQPMSAEELGGFDGPFDTVEELIAALRAPYPQEAEPDGRLWVGSGDAS